MIVIRVSKMATMAGDSLRLLAAVLLVAVSIASPTRAELPPPSSSLELIPAGSLIIAMDNDKQNIGSVFNLKAYGLANHLLWEEVRLSWAIRAGKAKDGIDFTVAAQRILPTATGSATLNFRGGPMIIHRDRAAYALPLITAYGNNVAVYETTADVMVEVRFTLDQRKKVGVLNDGGNAAIHSAVLNEAGFVSGQQYVTISATSLLTVNANACITLASEPHWDSVGNDEQTDAIRQYAESGGNFLAQCAAIESYENNVAHGLFQSTQGMVENNLGNTNHVYPNPDLAYSQFQGVLADGGGSISDYELAPGSVFQNGGHSHAHNASDTDRYIATASKLTVGGGGNVMYLGGHNYNGSDLGNMNGKRMYLNAAMMPSGRPSSCGFDVPVMPPAGIASISSAADQTFNEGDSATLASAITIADSATTPIITAGNDIRIRIPSSFNMTWDTSVTTVTLGGSAAGKVSTALLAYEDGGQTLVLNVTADFVAGDQLTIADPQFNNFSAPSGADNLELEVNNDGVISALNDKTIAINANTSASISSAADQVFIVDDPDTFISVITITESAVSKTIKKKNDLRIRIPAGFNMTWDTTIKDVTIGGPAANNMKTKLKAYEDGGRTMVLDVSKDFKVGDQITVSGAQFIGFSAPSPLDNLELEVNKDGVVTDLDDKTIIIVPPPVPNLLVLKASQTLEDPYNGTANPKSIPASTVRYLVSVTNSGDGAVDTDTLTIADPIPSNLSIRVVDFDGSNAGPIAFLDGSPVSGLSYTFTALGSATDDIEFSDDNQATWTYTPVDIGDGTDPAVTDIRINPKGPMAASLGAGDPSFQMLVKMIVQ
jgi:hypothetical protein